MDNEMVWGTWDVQDGVIADLKKMGVIEWKQRAKDHDGWRRVVEEARAHPGL
jgi:hypothetical protein